MPTIDISPDELKAAARTIAKHIPEFLALKQRLRSESRNVRRAVASALSAWVEDPITNMSQKERQALLEQHKAELARRGEPVD